MNLSSEQIKEGTDLMCWLMAFPATGPNTYDVRKDFLGTQGSTSEPEYQNMSGIHMHFHDNWEWMHKAIDEIHGSYAEVELLRAGVKIMDNGYEAITYAFDVKPVECAFVAMSNYLKWLKNAEQSSVSVSTENYETPDDLPF